MPRLGARPADITQTPDIDRKPKQVVVCSAMAFAAAFRANRDTEHAVRGAWWQPDFLVSPLGQISAPAASSQKALVQAAVVVLQHQQSAKLQLETKLCTQDSHPSVEQASFIKPVRWSFVAVQANKTA